MRDSSVTLLHCLVKFHSLAKIQSQHHLLWQDMAYFNSSSPCGRKAALDPFPFQHCTSSLHSTTAVIHRLRSPKEKEPSHPPLVCTWHMGTMGEALLYTFPQQIFIKFQLCARYLFWCHSREQNTEVSAFGDVNFYSEETNNKQKVLSKTQSLQEGNKAVQKAKG